jgi:hypothetical protein
MPIILTSDTHTQRVEDGYEFFLSILRAQRDELFTFFFIFIYLRAQRDEDGYEAGAASKPSYGYSLVQGRRPYMEDFIYSTLQYGQDKGSCFFGCFDGHCGKRAAMWAKEHLANNLSTELAVRAPKDALLRAFLRTDAEFLDKAWKENLNDGCAVLYCIVLLCIVLFCIDCIGLFCFVLFCIVLYCIVLYCIVLYCIVLYCIVLYCIVLY